MTTSPIELRDYQRKAVDDIFASFSKEGENPCVVAGTGSGKSIMIATFLKEATTYWPDCSFLMLTHQKELIEQDVKALLAIEPGLDIGIYSASLKRKELGHRITFASIQSIFVEKENPSLQFDVILVDECHLINNADEGRYQEFFKSQERQIVVTKDTGLFVAGHTAKSDKPILNTRIETTRPRIIGFTATPFRMGQGRLVEDGHIFTSYINTIGVLDLQKQGYLSRLTTKATATELDIKDVKIIAGEYAKGELDAAVNRYETNKAVAEEIAKKVKFYNRFHVIVFCTSVEHARNIADLLNSQGISAVSIEGSMSKKERENTLSLFTSGEVRAITNCNLLTTGFNYPAIDCVVLIRPTRSTGLYLQMVGRGIRISPETGKENCLLLDFGENVVNHGPIGNPRVNAKPRKKGEGLSPVKVCPQCLEVMERSALFCPSCGYVFPVKERKAGTEKTRYLFYGDPNGDGAEGNGRKISYVKSWSFFHTKTQAGKDMWVITYYCDPLRQGVDNTQQVKQFILTDSSYSDWVQKQNMKKLEEICNKVEGIHLPDYYFTDGTFDLPSLMENLGEVTPPPLIITAPQKDHPEYTEVVALISQKEFTAMVDEDNADEEAIEKAQRELYENTEE